MTKTRRLILILVSGLLLLTSCGKAVPAEDTLTPPSTEGTPVAQTSVSTEITSDTQVPPEDVVEWTYGLAYQSDVEKYGIICATSFYKWRQTGTPDWLVGSGSEFVVYDNNEGGITFEPLQDTYSAKDRDAQWGIDAISISDDIQILDYSEGLNIDKKIDGQWVRQAILDPDRAIVQGARPIGDRKQDILDAVFTISMDEVAFEIEPGEYRFIFYAYVSVSANRTGGYSMYYIPFEVVE